MGVNQPVGGTEGKPIQGLRGTGSAGPLQASPWGEAAQRRRGGHFVDI